MEARRLPVLRTIKLALRDTVGIIVRMPILCLLALLAAILRKLLEGIVVGPVSIEEVDARLTPEAFLVGFVKYIYIVPLAVFSCRFVIMGRSASWCEALRIKDIIITYGAVSIIVHTLVSLDSLIAYVDFDRIDPGVSVVIIVLFIIFMATFLYYAIRWCLIYPAIAVDQVHASLRWSARMTKGMVWRIFLVSTIPAAIAAIIILPFVFGEYVAMFGVWSNVFSALGSAISTIVFAAILSEIYLWCRANRDLRDDSALQIRSNSE